MASGIDLLQGDCLELLKEFPENFFDSCVTDPPYHLGPAGFMGKKWDASGVSFRVETWKEILRVLKPGGYLLAFGGSRTFHRIACAIEDAGFELRDTITWHCGSGFPKSIDIQFQISKLYGVCRSFGNVPHAVPNLGHSLRGLLAAKTPIALASALILPGGEPVLAIRIGAEDDSNEKMGISWFVWRKGDTNSNTASLWQKNWDTLSEKSKSFITETEIDRIIDLSIFKSLLGANTPEDTIRGHVPNAGCVSAVCVVGDNLAVSKEKLPLILKPIAPEVVSRILEGFEQWRGFGLNLKPSTEFIVMARKPISEKTVAANVLKWGTGGINIDGCRIYAPGGSPAAQRRKYKCRDNPRTAAESNAVGRIEYRGDPEKRMIPRPSESLGRFPANLILSHSPGCREFGTKRVKGSGSKPSSVGKGRDGNFTKGIYGTKGSKVTVSHVAEDGTEMVTAWDCVDGCPVAELDRQSGILSVCGSPKKTHGSGGLHQMGSAGAPGRIYQDIGGASRFFYCTKASRRERNGGMEPGERGGGRVRVEDFNIHPTVKPLKLMRYLARLVTPPGGVVLDPFAGSGTTGLAARAEGFESVLIEREAEYCRIIERRCGL